MDYQQTALEHQPESSQSACILKKREQKAQSKFVLQFNGCHDHERASELSEAASVGSTKSNLLFNPFSGRGRLMVQLAKKK